MCYRVYIGNKIITLTDNLSNTGVSYSYFNTNLNEIIHKLQSNKLEEATLYHHNLEEAWQNFKKHFDVIEAAGGLVENNEGKYLFIYRNGIWDLPKGKMEEGEKSDETAVREVQEECGVEHIGIDYFLLDTFHLFTENNKKRLKITHWYKMSENDINYPSPQTEEGIEKVEWIDIDKSPYVFENSYENIKLIFNKLK
jgi:8-oxo-dGTP pyrophosphatase MutT (NUDIX family)